MGKHAKALEMMRAGKATRAIMDETGLSRQQIHRLRRKLPEVEQRKQVKASQRAARKAAKATRKARRSKVLKRYMDGDAPKDIAKDEGVSLRTVRRVAKASPVGSMVNRVQKMREYKDISKKASQQARDLRKRSLEPHYFLVIWQLWELRPERVWHALLEGEAVQVAFLHERIDEADADTVMVLDDDCFPYVELAMEACDLYANRKERSDGSDKDADPIIGVGRTWRSLVYAHGVGKRYGFTTDEEQEELEL